MPMLTSPPQARDVTGGALPVVCPQVEPDDMVGRDMRILSGTFPAWRMLENSPQRKSVCFHIALSGAQETVLLLDGDEASRLEKAKEIYCGNLKLCCTLINNLSEQRGTSETCIFSSWAFHLKIVEQSKQVRDFRVWWPLVSSASQPGDKENCPLVPSWHFIKSLHSKIGPFVPKGQARINAIYNQKINIPFSVLYI